MARQLLSVQTVSRSKLVPTMTAATVDGFKVVNDGTWVFMFQNAGLAPITDITLVTGGTIIGYDIGDPALTVPNGVIPTFVGPFPDYPFDQPASSSDAGDIYVNTPTFANLTVAAIRIGT